MQLVLNGALERARGLLSRRGKLLSFTSICRLPLLFGPLQLFQIGFEVAQPAVFLADAFEMLKSGLDRSSIFFLQAVNRYQAFLHGFEASGVEAHGVAERRKRSSGVLKAINDLLHLIGEVTERFDVSRERLQQVRRARELGQC